MLQAMVDKQQDRGLSGNPRQMLKSFLHLSHELGFLSSFAQSQREIGNPKYKWRLGTCYILRRNDNVGKRGPRQEGRGSVRKMGFTQHSSLLRDGREGTCGLVASTVSSIKPHLLRMVRNCGRKTVKEKPMNRKCTTLRFYLNKYIIAYQFDFWPKAHTSLSVWVCSLDTSIFMDKGKGSKFQPYFQTFLKERKMQLHMMPSRGSFILPFYSCLPTTQCKSQTSDLAPGVACFSPKREPRNLHMPGRSQTTKPTLRFLPFLLNNLVFWVFQLIWLNFMTTALLSFRCTFY